MLLALQGKVRDSFRSFPPSCPLVSMFVFSSTPLLAFWIPWAQSMNLLQQLCKSPLCLVTGKGKFHQQHPSACRQINGDDRAMGRVFQLRTGDACSWDAPFSPVSQSLVSHASWAAAAGMPGAAWCQPRLLLCPVPSMGWHWDAEQAPCAAPSCLLHHSFVLLFAVASVTSAGRRQTGAERR